MDLRRIDPEHVPYLADLLERYPWASIRTHPSPELLSTIITGQNPHEHGIWQTRLRPRVQRTAAQQLIDGLPDSLTTTVQCVRHQIFHDCDVPTLPPRRRRRFEFHRLKFHGRADTQKLLERLGDVDSVVRAAGTERCSYIFTDRFNDREALLANAASGRWDLEIMQFHAMDMLGHWQLETPGQLRDYYRMTGEFVRRLHDKCRANGLLMAFLSDHGQERIIGTVDLRRQLKALDIPREEYSYYLQPITARFWFETDRARRTITSLLGEVPHGTLHTYQDLAEFDIRFTDGAFGEVYFLADPGYLFFPHDFHHTLTNFLFGLKDWQQRNRIKSGKHLSYHGYLPKYESERGFMILLDERYRVDQPHINLIDLAPSWLALIGDRPPEAMRGVPRFTLAA
jgi:hypothetical protein